MTDQLHRPARRADALSPVKRQLLARLTGYGARGGDEPVSPLALTLKTLWARVLGRDDFGVDDHFFRLGGDSILAIRVVNAVREELAVSLEVQQLYDQPTIRALAPIVESRSAARVSTPVIDDGDADVADEAREADGFGVFARPAGAVDAYPMSEMQKAMAFHAELGRRDRSYINHGEALVEGRWSPLAFAAALAALVRRHEILRTSFDFTSYPEPIQIVHRARTLPLPAIDLSAVADTHPDIARKVLAALSRRSFRLDAYPLIRITCVKERATRHHLAHAHHHAILDGWSLNLLFRELWASYRAVLHGTPADRPALRATYRQFVAIERATVRAEASQAYWRAAAGSEPPNRFPVPVSRIGSTAAPRARRTETTSVSLTLAPHVYAALKAMADAEAVHLATVLLAGHLACMSALHGQERIVTGRVVNGRPEQLDADQTLGLFVNTCLHTADLRQTTWRDLVRTTAAQERAARPHRRYPIAKMQELLGHTSPVETLFVFEHYHMHAVGPLAPDLRITGRDHAANDVKLVASFVLDAERTEVGLTLYGVPGDVPGWLLRRTAAWYRRAFDALAANPEAAVRIDAIVTPAEIHQQTIEWNDTARPLPPAALPADFERWTAVTPEAPALIVGERTLSYGALNALANRLAHLLVRTLDGSHGPVAILLEPGESQVVAVLAIVKAGFAYVPLDAAAPVSRVRDALCEARAEAVVTMSHLRDRFEAGAAADPDVAGARTAERAGHADTIRWLPLDRLQTDLDVANASNPGVALAGDRPIYVIFTSGSTGLPKAVRLGHAGRANNFHDFIRRFRIGPGDRVLAVSNLTFDMSAFDILGTLAAGAAIVAPTAVEKKDPRAWLRLCAEHGVTIWHSAPALLRMLLDALPGETGEPLRGMRLALLGGDWIPLGLPDRLSRVVPGIAIISLGGATEVSMDSTIHAIGGAAYPIPTVPYGRPMDNQTALLLGPRLQSTPIGAPGELHLGGVGLGDGYVNRPELTACRFLPHPYPATPGERVYKTGDQARYLGDGTLELLGRRDSQIKINGVRIEPAEIEKTLLACPAVEKAIVAVKDDANGRRRLAAYLVLARARSTEGAALTPEIRAFVKARLPASLQPSCFVVLDALPLTPNGKVNRLALPDPAHAWPADRTIVEPRTACERAVLETWRTVLRTTAIGVEDDFFEHGGDSVSATQIVSRLRAALGVDLPLALVFDNPTVAAQALHIEALREPAAADRAI